MTARRAVFCALIASLGAWSAAWAVLVRPVNLEEMVARAATIVEARCIRVENVDDDTGLPVVSATFEVRRSVKGDRGRALTIAVPSVDERVATSAFKVGDEVVLFLYGTSAAGHRSTVGLGQGTFRVQAGKDGRVVARNDLGNRGLLRGLSVSARGRLHAVAIGDGATANLSADDLLTLAESLLDDAP